MPYIYYIPLELEPSIKLNIGVTLNIPYHVSYNEKEIVGIFW